MIDCIHSVSMKSRFQSLVQQAFSQMSSFQGALHSSEVATEGNSLSTSEDITYKLNFNRRHINSIVKFNSNTRIFDCSTGGGHGYSISCSFWVHR